MFQETFPPKPIHPSSRILASMFRVEAANDHVNLLRMDDGKVNAIGPAFLDAFAAAWEEATRDGKAVVVAGNAKAFCAGLDLKVLPTLAREDLARFGGGFMRMFGEVAAHPRPTVAAVDGPALAGGAILALACDFRLVGPRARVGLTEVPVGIPFPAPVAELARLRLPPQEWAPALLRGAVREGAALVERGWAHEAHASDALEAAAVALAGELAAHNPRAYAPAKAHTWDGLPERLAGFAKDGADAWVDELLHEETIAAIVRGFERVKSRR